jgi:integrase
MRARPRGQKVHYYLDTGAKPRKEIPLGSDYVLAVQKWADLTSGEKPPPGQGTFPHVLDAYWKHVVPTKAVRTQKDNEAERGWLLKFFGNPPAPLDSIEPTHIKQYQRWRCNEARIAAETKNTERTKLGRPLIEINPKIGQVRANREKALFSHIWNFARSEGYTNKSNPCSGIKDFTEHARGVYVDDPMMAAVIAVSAKPLQFALRLALLTGQRPSDVVRMSETAIKDNELFISQGKTKNKLRMQIVGDLLVLLTEIRTFKADLNVQVPSLLIDESGSPLTMNALRNRFDDARKAARIDKKLFQFRDLRAKAATEADDASGTRTAQALLGHTTEGMTADYIRHTAGKKVQPLR